MENRLESFKSCLWQKNILFLQYHHKNLHDRFAHYIPKKNLLVSIFDETVIKETLVNYFYGQSGLALIDDEVEQFRQKNPNVNVKFPVPPPSLEKDLGVRFFSSYKNKILNHPLFIKQDFQSKNENVNFFPGVVFVGMGIGLQIEKLIRTECIDNITVFEADPDRFFYSLFVIDWEELITPFNYSHSKSFSWIIADGDLNNRDKHSRLLYLHLLRFCPSYPLLTNFYRHKSIQSSVEYKSYYDQILWKSFDDASMSLATWGNYDDEMIQINQARHNIKNGHDILSVQFLELNSIKSVKNSTLDIPVILVGAGPSLDESIELLRDLSSSCTIISCGSAITALYRYGLQPDYHVESESDYAVTYGYLESLKDPDYLKSIYLFAPLQMNPLVIQLFGQVTLFQKEGCTASLMISNHYLKDSAPTCLNAAFGLVKALCYKTIFLCGTDLGFKVIDDHHSTASIYYDDEAAHCFKSAVNYDKKSLIQLLGYGDVPIYTNAFYYTTKIRLELAIKSLSQAVKVYNLSQGVIIEGASHISNKDDIKLIVGTCGHLNRERLQYFSDNYCIRSEFMVNDSKLMKILDSNIDNLINHLRLFQTHIAKLLSPLKYHSADIREIHNCVMTIQSYLESVVRPKQDGLYSLLRGSVWQLCFILLYFNFYGTYTDEQQKKLNQDWYSCFKSFIDNVADHCHSILTRNVVTEQDPWLTQSINDNELDH